MARASSSSNISSPSFSSTWGLSRGTIIVPLDFRLSRRGRGLADRSSLCMEEDEEELVVEFKVGDEADARRVGLVVGGANAVMALDDAAGDVIFGLAAFF